MRNSIHIHALIVLSIWTTALHARIIHVPAELPTIQFGIRGAEDGDTVMVAPGTYYEHDIDFLGKAITVMSSNPGDSAIVASTIVVGSPAASVFTFQTEEGASSVLAGLTITGGNPIASGGGIYCNSSPTITRNIITGNSATRGGGICVEGGSAIITGNVVSGNSAAENGGGILIQEFATPTVKNNIIRNNSASIGGGGIRGVSAGGTIVNNMIVNNTAFFHGGGISLYGSSPDMSNNTIVGNQVTDNPDGGGIYCYFSSPTITNTIFWDNIPDQIYGDNPTVTYCNIQGGWPGEGNMNEDPMFLDPDNGNFNLPPGSPCIDAGDPLIFDACRPPGMGETLSDMGAFGGEENCDWRGGDQDVTLLIYPTSPTSVPRGEFLEFRAVIQNHRENTVEGELWLTVMNPDSTELLVPEAFLNYSNPLSGQIFPLNSLDLDNTLRVPTGATLGTYRLIGRVGVYPDLVLDEDSIGFRVI